jgi:hypothetical protein
MSESSMLIAHGAVQRCWFADRERRGDQPLAQLGPGIRQMVKDHTPKFVLRTKSASPGPETEGGRFHAGFGGEDWLTKSDVSLFEQTIKSTPNRVCAVPLWLFQVPGPDARPVHDA